jgi:hypothetical protein
MQCNERRNNYYKNLSEEKKQEYYDNRDKDKQREASKKSYEKNKEEINARQREKGKEIYQKNKEREKERYTMRSQDPEYKAKRKECAHKRYLENRDEILEKTRSYRIAHPEETKRRQREWKAHKRATDPEYRLIENSRVRICEILRNSKSKKSKEYLGCSALEFRQHIEKQFKEGMNWDNYGEWQVDHIVPIKYNSPSIEELMERLHFTNTQPLWALENIKKGNRHIG